tara:strand:- start:2194 stop:3381 length:1188 start_codon:yes stop_codon:yes gene_type:complete
MGFDMKEGTVAKWRKQEGEQVSRGEVIAEIETDKAVVEMEAYASGTLRKIMVHENNAVPVGTLIAIIADPDEDISSLETSQQAFTTVEDKPLTSMESSAATTQESASQGRDSSTSVIKASPIARRLAKEMNVDLTLVNGTGPGGRITEADVKSFQPESPRQDDSTINVDQKEMPLSKMRQAIANKTIKSTREAPHFYVTSQVDMGKAMDFRRELNPTLPDGVRVSVNDLIIKACALAISKYPNFNASYRGDKLLLNSRVNIGIAIALSEGLIIAGLSDCQDRDLVNVAKASRDLIDRANGGTLKAEEYEGVTFAISNLGMFDVESFSAIIYPPNAAVVAIGSVIEQPAVKAGEIVVARLMKMTISLDHRVVDGAEGAKFLQEVKRLLESPKSLMD